MTLQRQATFECSHLPSGDDAAAERAAPAATLRVSGEVTHELLLTLDELRALPAISVSVPDRDGSPPAASHTYTGVLLRDVLQHAGVPVDATRNNDVCSKYVAVIARDGYCVTLAYCELLAPFGHQRALLAYAVDDEPAGSLANLALVLPDDPNACRWAKRVNEIRLGDPRSMQIAN